MQVVRSLILPPLIDDGSWLKAPTLMIAQKNDALPFTVTGLLPNFYQSEPEHETRFWVGNQSYSCKLCGVDECSFKDTLLDYYTVDKILLILDCTYCSSSWVLILPDWGNMEWFSEAFAWWQAAGLLIALVKISQTDSVDLEPYWEHQWQNIAKLSLQLPLAE